MRGLWSATQRAGAPQHAAHLTDDGLRCANCCPVHRQASAEWTGEPATVGGEQAGLF